MPEKEKEVADKIRDKMFGEKNAEKMREHNRELEKFDPNPKPRESPSPKPSESPNK